MDVCFFVSGCCLKRGRMWSKSCRLLMNLNDIFQHTIMSTPLAFSEVLPSASCLGVLSGDQPKYRVGCPAG